MFPCKQMEVNDKYREGFNNIEWENDKKKLPKNSKYCNWKPNFQGSCFYKTDCVHTFEINYSSIPKKENYNFCPKCGKPIEVKGID